MEKHKFSRLAFIGPGQRIVYPENNLKTVLCVWTKNLILGICRSNHSIASWEAIARCNSGNEFHSEENQSSPSLCTNLFIFFCISRPLNQFRPKKHLKGKLLGQTFMLMAISLAHLEDPENATAAYDQVSWFHPVTLNTSDDCHVRFDYIYFNFLPSKPHCRRSTWTAGTLRCLWTTRFSSTSWERSRSRRLWCLWGGSDT